MIITYLGVSITLLHLSDFIVIAYSRTLNKNRYERYSMTHDIHVNESPCMPRATGPRVADRSRGDACCHIVDRRMAVTIILHHRLRQIAIFWLPFYFKYN